ncbi:MAG: 2-oxo acid dehydrogenase subunit E2 [Chloroflexi bacterium]|nr:2-oxo acid dehydrogenase subunit E2 [Chloroflexota bacterium]
MKNKPVDYKVVPFPQLRQVVIDSLRMAHRKHTVCALLEVDVTEVRQYLREHKAKTGESLSFTAFIITCLGRAVDEDKITHAYLNWRNQLVIFDEVDVTTIIEIEAGEQTFPFAHVIRAANKRTFRDIHQEIRAIQAKPESSQGLQQWQFLRWFIILPAFIRQIFYGAFYRMPHLVKQYIGTVEVTAVGMFGKGGGWAIIQPIYTLSLAIGGIAEKPGIVDRRIEIREYLSLTISFDHDIIDGAPAARFTQRLKELIESGYGLTNGDTSEGMKT